MDTMSKEQGASHEIIKATEMPDDGVKLIIRWSPDGFLTNEHVSEAAAVALGWQRQPAPPAPPAWMVEVVREANAAGYDAANAATAAAAARAGERDHDLGAATAIRALRLALERGHVVEAPVTVPAVSGVDLEPALTAAWQAGRFWARSRADEALNAALTPSTSADACARHVLAVLSTLPTRGA